MRKIRFLLLFTGALVALPQLAISQRNKTIELKPVYNRGFTFYYDLKKLRTPYALQLPLLSLGDDEATRRYLNFERLKYVSGLVWIAPTIMLLNIDSGSFVSAQQFSLVLLGALAVNLTCNLLAHRQLKKGVERYNIIIVGPSSQIAGLRVSYKF
jgi:hypothetical protein